MLEMLQHVIVTIVALGAVGVIVRRVAGVVQPGSGKAPCASCPSARAQGLPDGGRRQPACGSSITPETKPLTLVR